MKLWESSVIRISTQKKTHNFCVVCHVSILLDSLAYLILSFFCNIIITDRLCFLRPHLLGHWRYLHILFYLIYNSVAISWKNNSARSSEKFGRREKNSAISSRCLYDHCWSMFFYNYSNNILESCDTKTNKC